MGRYISFAVLLGIIIVIGALFYKVMIGFFVPVFLAVILVVVFRPLHRWVSAKVGEREHLAASITTTLIVLIVLLPAALIITMAAVQGTKLFANVNFTTFSIGLSKLRSNSIFNLESPCVSHIRTIQTKVEEVQRKTSEANRFEDISDSKGIVASDVRDIGSQLAEMFPVFQKDMQRRLELKIKTARKNAGAPANEQSQADDELYVRFEHVADDIQDLRKIIPHDSSNKEDEDAFQEKLAELLRKQDPMVGILSGEEKKWFEESRVVLIQRAVAWERELKKMNDALAKLPSVDGKGLPPEQSDMSTLQNAVFDLGRHWQSAREAISGGRVMDTLLTLANPSGDDVKAWRENVFEYIRPRLLSFGGDSAVFLIRLIVGSSILLVSLYFFLYDGPGMVRSLMELSPLDDRYELELLAEFDRISRAIVLATVLSALLQGLTAGVGYYFAGMPSLILLIALTSTCALVPFIGPAIVWVPVCLYLAVYEERFVAAGLLALWGMMVVGTVDNLVKVFVLHGQSQLHPLLALLSVLGGIQALGPIGIVVGPMVVTLLQTTLGILRHELTQFKTPDETEDGASPPDGSLVKPMSGLIRKIKKSVEQKNSETTDSFAEKSDDSATSGDVGPGLALGSD